MTDKSTAADDWNARIGLASDARTGGGEALPAPDRVRATIGAGHTLLDWEPVDGALGYLVHRAAAPDGPFEPVDHGGGDVLAVPAPPYADTTVDPSDGWWYAVGTWTEAGSGPLSEPVRGVVGLDPGSPVRIEVDAAGDAGPLRPVWRKMIGSEHLSLLTWDRPGPGGSNVAAEFAEALRVAHDELGVEYVRAHGTFLPEMVDAGPDGVADFRRLDRVYDRLRGLGLRPVVELSFMPAPLASDPTAVVFDYAAIVSPPADLGAWHRLCRDLAAHLVDRYGLDEVRQWLFEVWNEANLEVFWSGSHDDYHRLYAEAARAIKSVDSGLRVGGPGSARAEWVGDLLAYAREEGVAVDFVSTHTYGNAPLNLRPLTARHARAGHPEPEILWTEWGVTPTHFHPVSDSMFAAPFVLHGVKAALDTTDALAYWVISDHFEELGWPKTLFHGGFGLLTVGNLRKPRYWALHLLNRLAPARRPADRRLPVEASGDGAWGLVDALAAGDGGEVRVLIWNSTIDQGRIGGSAALDRTVELIVHGLAPGRYRLELTRLDAEHGNIMAVWEKLGRPDWPDQVGWQRLRAADRLDVEPLGEVDGGQPVRVDLPLKMPAAALVELRRIDAGADAPGLSP